MGALKVFIIAGEASGDRLGAALMEGLQSIEDVEFKGVGGPLMQGQGLVSQFPMDELSVMGLAEILPKYFHLKRRIRETAQAVIAAQPDVLITIDSPDFCLRVAKQVKAETSIRTVHYVAPTVWAWRAGRAAKMAKVIDHVLALFPFEPPYMTAAGMACDFVGHPVVAEPRATEAQIDAFRARHGLESSPILLILPGSRTGEVSRLTPIFGQSLGPILDQNPHMQLVIPTTANVTDLVTKLTKDWPVRPLILDPRDMKTDAYRIEKACAFQSSDLALAASGTVSLELAAAETPMVIAYDMSPISRFLISRMLKTDTVTLVNLVSDTRHVPEFIGQNCDPALIGSALVEVSQNPNAQIDAMRTTMDRLGKKSEAPGLRAARAVLRGLGR